MLHRNTKIKFIYMKKLIKTLIHRVFFWVFKEQVNDLHYYITANKDVSKRLKNMLDNIDVSVDHNIMAKSWAVISIQGQNKDFIKFIDLDAAEIRTIQAFLQNFDRRKIDASPEIADLLRIRKFF